MLSTWLAFETTDAFVTPWILPSWLRDDSSIHKVFCAWGRCSSWAVEPGLLAVTRAPSSPLSLRDPCSGRRGMVWMWVESVVYTVARENTGYQGKFELQINE